MKWLMYTRGTIHLHRFAMALRATADGSEDLLYDSPIKDLLYINIGPKLWFAWNEKEIKNYGKVLLTKITNPKEFLKHARKLKALCKLANIEAEKIRKANFAKLSNAQLVKLYQNLYKKTGPVQMVLGADIDAIDIVLEKFLMEALRKELPKASPSEINEIYKQISAPAYKSYLSVQHQMILRAATKKDAGKEAVKIHSKYWWTPLGWENMKPHSVEYYVKQIIKCKKSKNLPTILKTEQKHLTYIKQRRKHLVTSYKLSPRFQYLLRVVDEYTQLHDLRKEMQVRNVYAFHLLMKESARRLKIKPEDGEWLWFEEITEALLSGKKDKHEIAKRKKAYAVIIEKHKMRSFSGNQAIALKERILKEQATGIKEVKGMGVTTGKVVGTAKVCSGYAEALRKIRPGDVLITGMTLPDYLPAMKKAAAIVTDEGGITCHASIVSRELGKVCVVGTKTASQVFKDGYKIEVDADHGIIRKI